MMRLKIIILSVIISFIFYSCNAFNPLSEKGKEANAEAEIKGAIAHSSFFDDSGQAEDNKTKKGETWYRVFDTDTPENDITMKSLDIEKGTAEVEVVSKIGGKLKGGSWNKSFSNTTERRAFFERKKEGWEVVKITPSYSSSKPVPGISIKNVIITNVTDSKEIIRINRLLGLDTEISRDRLPTLRVNTEIKIVVEISSANTTNCYFHYNNIERKKMVNNGVIFTVNYTLPNKKGIFNVYIDLLSASTLPVSLSSDNEFIIWGIPFIVE